MADSPKYNAYRKDWELAVPPGGGGGGAVTSVGLSMPAEFSVSGSPVVTSGTLTATKVSQAANKVYAAPDGSTGAPSFRALAAGDMPAATATLRGGLTLANDLSGTADAPQVTQARGLRESGGTTLGMGAVADRQVLQRSGTTIVGVSVANAFVDEDEVVGSAATQMQVAGLDLSTDQEYYIRAEVKNANAGTVAFYFEVNGSTTTTGYYRQVIAGNNTTLAGQRDNAPTLRTALTGEVMSFRIWLALDFDGKPRMSWISGYSAGSTIQHASGSWLFNTAGNVTSIEIVGASASSLAVGSKMKVFRTTGGTA